MVIVAFSVLHSEVPIFSIVQLRSCRLDNIMWLRQGLTVGTYSAPLNILGGAVAILFVSLTLSLMMAIKACLKNVTSLLTEQLREQRELNFQLREQRELNLKLIHRLEQGSLDVKETVISKEGVPSDHHQPQLHTLVKPEDAQRILVLNPKLTRQKSRSPKPHGVAAVTRTPSLASEMSMASNRPSLLRRSSSSGTLFDASNLQKRIESRKQSSQRPNKPPSLSARREPPGFACASAQHHRRYAGVFTCRSF